MALSPNQLAVKQSPAVAEMVAAAILDIVRTLPRSTGVEKTVVRQLTKHAHEVLELHDLAVDEVMPTPGENAASGNGYVPTHEQAH